MKIYIHIHTHPQETDRKRKVVEKIKDNSL